MTISPPLNPGEFVFNEIKLGHSSFNPEWLFELGIEPKVIFDIGGYDGGDAIRFKQMFPRAEVHCFEADPARADIIRQYRLGAGVYFMGAAIMDYTGRTSFYQSRCMLKDAGDTHLPGQFAGQGSVYRHTNVYKNLYPHIEQEQESIFVPCFALWDYCQNWANIADIDLLHIDVEGAEINVVKGLGNIRPKLIYVETLRDMFENVPSVSELHEILSGMDYKLVQDFTSDRLYIYKNN